MTLEARSGPKTLLKLLLEKTGEVLTQSETNAVKLNELSIELEELKTQLKILNKSTDDITGNHYDGQDII